MPDENPTSKTIDKTSHGMSYKVFALIGVLAIIDLVYGLYYFDGSFFDIKDGFFMAGIAACGISSFVVAKKYHGSEMLGKAYLFLGLGFFSWFIGDVGYYHAQFVLGIDPWPSIFDLGFLLSYVFAILHLYLNTRFFQPKWSKQMKGILIGIPAVALITYNLFAYQSWGVYDELASDLFFTSLYVLGISTTLALAIIGASVFRNSVLKETWLLLAIGIFFWAVGDSIYVFLETIEEFTHNHPINSLWSVAFMVIIYALYKHHKAL